MLSGIDGEICEELPVWVTYHKGQVVIERNNRMMKKRKGEQT